MPKPRANAPKPKPKTPPTKADWDRDQFSLRLTAARRGRLLRIVADMPDGSTPSEAVDRAVERSLATSASAGKDATVARLDALEELCERFEQERKRDAAELRATCGQTLRRVWGIAELMSAVAAAPTGDEDMKRVVTGSLAETGHSLRSWLDALPRATHPVVAVGRWHSKTRLADKTVAVEFEIAMAGSATRSIVLVSPLPSDNPLARVVEEAAIRFACARDASGLWSVEARHLNPDRTAAGVICSLSL
jgi:hypothetical protein